MAHSVITILADRMRRVVYGELHRIIKDCCGFCKRDSMVLPIKDVFSRIPFNIVHLSFLVTGSTSSSQRRTLPQMELRHRSKSRTVSLLAR